MRVVYFVHDLNDPAVMRRVQMLRAGGLDVTITGFWRGDAPTGAIEGVPVLPLGRTFDARLVQRGLAALRQILTARRLHARLAPADLFVARNLEMLAVAAAAARDIPIVYEALDIHRLLLGRSAASILLRRVERALMKRATLLLTSSPAFLRAYFQNPDFDRPPIPALVIENRPLSLDNSPDSQEATDLPPGPPWHIGWFGMLRCRRSLGMLAELARRHPDLVRVRIFGRAADPVRDTLDELARKIPALEFGGAYEAADLTRLYAGVHFSWAIDYFEEGANSEWLLPNRIYEAGSCNTVSLALRRTETGRWLDARGLGVLLDNPQTELEAFLGKTAPVQYESLKHAAATAPRSHFVADRSDCMRLAESLADVARGTHCHTPQTVIRAAA
ncbi:MAG TPA: glycosyltransferase [Rhizomicrobium sp.]|jgi:hypothetical protein